MEEVCFDENFAHCFMLFVIYHNYYFFRLLVNYIVNQIKEELADNSIKIEEPFFQEDSAYTPTEVSLTCIVRPTVTIWPKPEPI